jgi:polysaccharide export outer membrane protein
MIMKRFIYLLSIVALASSCKTPNILMGDCEGAYTDILNDDPSFEHKIRPDDKISLSIWNHDDLSLGSAFNIYNTNEAFGKWLLVDEEGKVAMPKLGHVELGGLTTREAADTLEVLYGKYIVDPIIGVKVLNKEVTVLGEVRQPGKYVMEREVNHIGDAIAMAQGFEYYADVNQVQLIRDGVGYMIDLEYLEQDMLEKIIVESGDVINVPSRKGKGLDMKAPTMIPFASLITATAIFLTLFL